MGTDIINSVKALKAKILPESRLILFGSRARGDARPDSDWDFLILLNEKAVKSEDFDRYAYPFVELGWQFGAYFSMKMFTQQDWDTHKGHPFFKNVTQEGIEL